MPTINYSQIPSVDIKDLNGKVFNTADFDNNKNQLTVGTSQVLNYNIIDLDVEYGLIEYQDGWPFSDSDKILGAPASFDVNQDGIIQVDKLEKNLEKLLFRNSETRGGAEIKIEWLNKNLINI